jgi:hypothetical protein
MRPSDIPRIERRLNRELRELLGAQKDLIARYSKRFPDKAEEFKGVHVGSVLNARQPEPTYRCSKCKGTNVQHAHWVMVNTDEVLDEYGSWNNGDNNYCNDCGDHQELEEIKKLEPNDPFEAVQTWPAE